MRATAKKAIVPAKQRASKKKAAKKSAAKKSQPKTKAVAKKKNAKKLSATKRRKSQQVAPRKRPAKKSQLSTKNVSRLSVSPLQMKSRGSTTIDVHAEPNSIASPLRNAKQLASSSRKAVPNVEVKKVSDTSPSIATQAARTAFPSHGSESKPVQPPPKDTKLAERRGFLKKVVLLAGLPTLNAHAGTDATSKEEPPKPPRPKRAFKPSMTREDALKDLLEGFVDSKGFHVSKDEHDEPTDQGDAVIFSAITAAALTLQNHDAEATQFISTLESAPWHHDEPIRHPDVFEYSRKGASYQQKATSIAKHDDEIAVAESNGDDNLFELMGYRPMSKDGLIGIMGACSVIQAHADSPKLKNEAAALYRKHTRFLQQNQWRTLRELPPAYKFKCGDRFCDVYARKVVNGRAEYHRNRWLGFESFTFSMAERRALNAVASSMGIILTHPFAELTVDTSLIQSAVDIVSNLLRHEIEDKIISNMPLRIDISIPLVQPPITQTISLTLPEDIVDAIGDSIQTLVREVIRVGTAQPEDVIVLIADRLVSDVPYWLGGESWEKGVRSVLRDTLPWLNREPIGDLVWLLIELEIAKRSSDKYGPSERHMAFWTTLAIYNARPELRSLISSYLHDFCSAVSGDHDALFQWLAENDSHVTNLLKIFESDVKYQNIDNYAWTTRSWEWLEDSESKSCHSRLDYLILDGLKQKGRLRPLERHFADLMREWVHKWIKDAAKKCPICGASGISKVTEKIPCPNPNCKNGKVKVKCKTCKGIGKIDDEIKGCPLCHDTKKIKQKKKSKWDPRKYLTEWVPCPCNVRKVVLKVVKTTCPKCNGDKLLPKFCPKCDGEREIQRAVEKTCPICNGRKVVTGDVG